MKLTLPLPPRLNRYYRHDRGVTHLSQEGRAFKEHVYWLAKAAGAEPLRGAVRVTIDVYRQRKAGDLDGYAKATLDALNGLAYLDDSQVVELILRRFDDRLNPRAEVDVYELAAAL